jgi:hypothetical protein
VCPGSMIGGVFFVISGVSRIASARQGRRAAQA